MFKVTKAELIAHMRSDWAIKVSTKAQAMLLIPYLRNCGTDWWVIWELIKRGTCFYFDGNELMKTTTPDPSRKIIEFKNLKIVEA